METSLNGGEWMATRDLPGAATDRVSTADDSGKGPLHHAPITALKNNGKATAERFRSLLHHVTLGQATIAVVPGSRRGTLPQPGGMPIPQPQGSFIPADIPTAVEDEGSPGVSCTYDKLRSPALARSGRLSPPVLMEDRRILDQFPLPLARGYRRYLNAPESKERHDLGYFLFEIYLKYLSATAIAAYLASPERDHRVNAALKGLLRPSLGEWLRFLRECRSSPAAGRTPIP